MDHIADIRKEYSKASLTIEDVHADPIQQFNKWFNEAVAAKVDEPNAMTLSTVTSIGQPSGRIVLLKGVERDRFIFFTNYQSQKGKELENNSACALTFFWPALERQVRIQGIATRISEEASTAYFQSRPLGSQIGAWASPQSAAIGDRTILENRVKELEKKYEGQAVLPRPKQWGGYEVTAHELEFWQGRQSRLHDRLVYQYDGSNWKIQRLAP